MLRRPETTLCRIGLNLFGPLIQLYDAHDKLAELRLRVGVKIATLESTFSRCQGRWDLCIER
eukprot:5108471-Amphidinium_carterae.1